MDGRKTYTYLSSGIGGVDILFVRGTTDKDTASATIDLKITGLQELTDGEHYDLVGAFGEPGVTSRHRRNHYGTSRLNSKLISLADSVFADSSLILRINDISLQFGGPFDIDNNWNTPHEKHRAGVSVDIDNVDHNRRNINLKYLEERVKNDPFKGTLTNHRNHFHVTFTR